MAKALELDVEEAERLREELLEPWRCQERRVEMIDFISDRHFKMTVKQQVWSIEAPSTPTRLVSLGLYSKSRRPTLDVTAASGAAVPIVSRTEQAKIPAYLYIIGVVTELNAEHSDLSQDEIAGLADKIAFFLERIVSSPTARAKEAFCALICWLDQIKTQSRAAKYLLDLDTAWTRLEGLISSCQILVRITEPCDRHLVLHHSYSQEFPYYRPAPVDSWSARAAWHDLTGLAKERKASAGLKRAFYLLRNILASVATRLLMRVGVIPTVIGRRCQNADHSESFYLLIKEPAGSICARNYWQDLKSKSLDLPTSVSDVEAAQELTETEKDLALEHWHSDLVCYAAHSSVCETSGGDNRCYLELRPARGSDKIAAFLLAMLSIYVSVALARGWYSAQATASISSLFLAVPGALTATLTRNSSALSKRVSSGLLLLGYLAGGTALLMAASTPTSSAGSWWRIYSSISAALASTLLAAVLLWVIAFSRFFDSPQGPVATLPKAAKSAKREKLYATGYAVAALVGSVCLAAWLWSGRMPHP